MVCKPVLNQCPSAVCWKFEDGSRKLDRIVNTDLDPKNELKDRLYDPENPYFDI